MNRPTDTDVLIIGAGASGIMAACAASGTGARTLAVDGNDRAGRKLSATGNGRCNFTNTGCRPEDYNEGAEAFVRSVFSRFDNRDAMEAFEKAGLPVREEQEGRCYPYSGQAAAVTDMLVKRAGRSGTDFRLGDPVTACSCEDGIFSVEFASGDVISSRSLVIATGGRAGLRFGSTGDGYGFARGFGHSLAAPRPALVPCVSEDEALAGLRGRARGRVTLYEDGAEKYSEYGEIQFTGTGLSGICVMNLTRYMDAPRPAPKKKKKKARAAARSTHSYAIGIDFLPEYTEQEISAFLESGMKTAPFEEALSWLVNSRIAAAVAAMCIGEDAGSAGQLINKAAGLLKNFMVDIQSTKGWVDAQVTRGGVRNDEVDPESLESRLRPGLFLCGEVLDVDGPCGGYNLQWAWSSGYLAGISAGEYVKNA